MDERRHYLEERLEDLKEIIRQQQQTISELELRKNQYDLILENMSDLVEISDEQFYLHYVNKSLAKFYGTTQEKLLNTDTLELVLEEDREKIYEMMSHVSAENPEYQYEYRVNINGKIYWMESIGRGFYRDDGTAIEYLDVSRDITEYKTIKEELEHMVELRTSELASSNRQLKEVNDYLHSILSGISEGIVVLDVSGNCEFLNYGPNELWRDSEQVITDYFKSRLNDKDSNELNWMFLKKRPFADVEMHIPSGRKTLSIVVSGRPLLVSDEMVVRSILVLKPAVQVRQMVTRMSGAQARFHFSDIVTTSPRLLETIALAKQAANSDVNILIEGESGTGKEMFAQSIHNASFRRNGPFVAVNCGAIPRELVASELFGYVEGSFTGAKKGGKPGKFELADGGTIFLDEIGDMPLEQQVTLLRVIQERRVTRVGGVRDIPVDVRIICATNRDLRQEALDNNFREDLYYRLNVIGLNILPLRDRKEDILPLFCSFWAQNAGCDSESFLKLLQPDVLDVLSRYDWPGNVRELENVADRMMYLSDGKAIVAEYLPRHIRTFLEGKEDEDASESSVFEVPSIRELRAQKKESRLNRDRKELVKALEAAGGNISEAARRMGISRATFYRKLKLEKERK